MKGGKKQVSVHIASHVLVLERSFAVIIGGEGACDNAQWGHYQYYPFSGRYCPWPDRIRDTQHKPETSKKSWFTQVGDEFQAAGVCFSSNNNNNNKPEWREADNQHMSKALERGNRRI